MQKKYNCPTQIKFKDDEGNILGGIAYNDVIICGCCGSTFEVNETEIVEEYKHWVNISDEIIGE